MNLSTVFGNIRKNYRLDDLESITKENFEDVKLFMVDGYNTYEKLKNTMENCGLDINKLKFVSDDMGSIWYIDEPAIIDMRNLFLLYAEQINGKIVESIKKDLSNDIETRDWAGYFVFLPENFRMDRFNKLQHKMTEDERMDVLEDLYVSLYYPMQLLDRGLFLSIFKKGRYADELKRYADKDGMITIYRGETSKSTRVDKALSYTVKYDVAVRFAIMFDELNPVIYKGKVHVNDVRLYTENRNEYEVIVDFKDIVGLKMLDIPNIDSYRIVADELIKYKKIAEKLNRKGGIHGISHSKRMIDLTCLWYDNQDELYSNEYRTLLAACTLHDIGRVNGAEDYGHGQLSVEYIEKNLDKNRLMSTFNISNEDLKVMKMLIKYHSAPDNIGISAILSSKNIKDKERCLELFLIFKDIDGLDRVRIRDLDASYLRHDLAKRLVPMAHLIYRGTR